MGPNRISELAAGAMAQTKGLAMPMKEAVGADVEVRAAMATAMTVPRRELISAMAAGLIGSGHDDASSRSYCRFGGALRHHVMSRRPTRHDAIGKYGAPERWSCRRALTSRATCRDDLRLCLASPHSAMGTVRTASSTWFAFSTIARQ